MSDTVLVIGGAGYVGSALIPHLLKSGFKVKVLDLLIFGKDGISELISQNKIDFIEGDIRNEQILDQSTNNVDHVINLAAIVGEPLCKLVPKIAKEINELTNQKLVDICKKKNISRFIFSSTCSNYGSSTDLADETFPVNSLSLYSETKVNSEKYLLKNRNNNFHPCILRFATAYGVSPRMRFDLLLHEFIRDAIVDKKITLFGAEYWRPLVHLNDISQACILALQTPIELISGEIFNVGSNEENYTKLQIAQMVQSMFQNVDIEIIDSKKDPRNYRVSFNKIKDKLGFSSTMTLFDGIQEIKNAIDQGLNPQDTDFTNTSNRTKEFLIKN